MVLHVDTKIKKKPFLDGDEITQKLQKQRSDFTKKIKKTCSCLLYGGLMFVFKLLLMLGTFRVCDDISQFVAWLLCFLGGCPHTNPQVLISTSLLL